MSHEYTFADRHIGPSEDQTRRLLEVIGVADLDALARAAVPAGILDDPADPADPAEALPPAIGEAEALAELAALAARNTVRTSMIGLGYHDTIVPSVILRNVFENPAWYTAYTPYQPEISQGRLEALLNFQTMVADLTGLPVANASLLDEATAAAEAMALLRRAGKSKSDVLLIDADLLPQTKAVVATRAQPLGVELVEFDAAGPLPDIAYFGVLLQYPGASGRIVDPGPIIEQAHAAGALVAVGADILALTVLTPPGALGADACFGTTQRFGTPMGFGGPHAGYLSVGDKASRQLPGRLVGVSVDADGSVAYRLALQTREQHIRREKATSNICTAQVLPAILSAMYATYHGPDGLRAIAERVAGHAARLARELPAVGATVVHDRFFDTVFAAAPGRADAVVAAARARNILLRPVDADHVGIACDEVTAAADIDAVLAAFAESADTAPAAGADPAGEVGLPAALVRGDDYLTHPVFHRHRTETTMMRYLRALADKDIALDRSMIPLGSCTMKLNAATEMEPVTWPGFSRLHPLAPAEDTAGIRALIADLERYLAIITGYDAVSLQPNAGSQGELAGLMAIAAYHRGRGDTARDVCLIPSSAHGTNAASAVMAGMRVVVVACRPDGDVDPDDLAAKIEANRDRLSALMVTYPSTHGVYEEAIGEVCAAVHDAGGQVYIDGANLNALVGLARPGRFGGDVSHLNLHKTFCIPHGGGGPGVGPVAVREHLRAYLPGDPMADDGTGVGPVAGARWGSASILPITWAYIRMMGADGLRRATLTAIASANYIARRLDEHYPVLYTGPGGMVAHECIIDVRPLTKATGVTVDDIAKRLADYGFHAPTMSFPVAGTLMIEPTESEDLAEIDAFCDALIAIRREVDRVAAGDWPIEDSPLRNAPHTAHCLVEEWTYPYDRATAVYPGGTGRPKIWPSVRRIDGARGDRNLMCSCPPIESFA